MRLKLTMKVEKNHLPLDYRSLIMSYLKKSTMEILPDFYTEMFDKTFISNKEFTFAVFLNSPTIDFKQELVFLGKNIFTVILSSYEDYIIDNFEKALIMYRADIPVKGMNSMHCVHIEKLDDIELDSNDIKIQLQSPMLVRKHEVNQDNTIDEYLTINNDDFVKYLKIHVKSIADLYGMDSDNFEFIPLKMKHTFIRSIRRQFIANIGTAEIKGNPDLLKLLYDVGLGTRRGQGFGMFKIIG